jgi:hypothetical protein
MGSAYIRVMISGVGSLPSMRVLGYQPTRPRLRVLSLPEQSIEPSPVPLNGSTCALDSGFIRDGWIAFTPSLEVWGMPVPLGGKAFKVGRWWDCVPAVDPRTVWLGVPVDPDPRARRDMTLPTLVVEYDGVERVERQRLELDPGMRLDAATEDGLVLRADSGALLLFTWGSTQGRQLAAGGPVIAQHGAVVACRQRDPPRGSVLLFVHTGTGSKRVVSRPAEGAWGIFGSFSPDGRLFAVSIGDWGMDADCSLALIDVATGDATLAEGSFQNHASTPVWNADGSWLVFDAPFDKSLFACNITDTGAILVPIVRRRGRPGPILDVTGIV